jgi:hypothetical protein
MFGDWTITVICSTYKCLPMLGDWTITARWVIGNQLLVSDELRFAYHEARRTV